MKSIVITIATLCAGFVYGGELAPAQKSIQKSALQKGAVQKGAMQKGAVQKGAVQKGAVQKGAVQKDSVQQAACVRCDHRATRIEARQARRATRRS